MLARVRRWLESESWQDRAASVVGFGCVLVCIAIVLAPTFERFDLYGGHDWDEMTAHRLLTVKALLRYGQLPLWMPYGCGGFSEWGSVMGASNLVSPFLPVYLLLELRQALRVELVGTLLISAVGTWLFAGQFTRSAAARTFACLVFVANGRYALQTATGHLWHLEYCYTPWVFWAFERIAAERKGLALAPWCMGASALALMLYGCGIYPLPHTVLLLGVYAVLRAALTRGYRPIFAVAALGALSVGLTAPKLFAILVEFGERPRLVASTEAINLNVLWQALTVSQQTPGSRPAPIPQWGWHEYGMYMGWVPALLVLLGTLWWAPRRELSLKVAGILGVVLGLGAFHELSPWALLHQVGWFRSQHVPTRWLYPASLLLGVSAAAVFGRALATVRDRSWVEPLLLGGCLLLAVDIGREAAVPMRHAFWMELRPVPEAPNFQQFERVPRRLQYRRRDYAPEALPAVYAGSGVIECTLHMSLNVWAPQGADGRPHGMGARGRDASGYRGEAFTASGVGRASIVSFSPNEVVVQVDGVQAGDRLVLNQNFDPGWRANGAATEPYRDAIATKLTAPSGTVTFRFWPRGLTPGLVVFIITLAGVIALYLRERRRVA